MGHSDHKYWAFLSYSHRDQEWVGRFHSFLETYRVPRQLVGRQGKCGKIPRRLVPIFRDRDELPADADLSGKVKVALSQSCCLVVICSPNSAKSKWVSEEINGFRLLGRGEFVLPLILDGEPNSGDDPVGAQQECFPEPLRERAGDQLAPIAADARKGKDGEANARLKILAGILGVGFDELKQREKRRRFWQRVRIVLGTFALLLLATIGYIASADAGLSVPGGEQIRARLDRNGIFLFRAVHSDAAIRKSALAQRRVLYKVIASAQSDNGLMYDSLKVKNNPYVWVTSQALTGIFHSPDLSNQDLQIFIKSLEAPFAPGQIVERNGVKEGWPRPTGESNPAMPPLWTAAALTTALERNGLLTREEHERAQQHFIVVQEILKAYRPDESGGWNIFPNEKDPSPHNAYPTALALLVLLETREANLPWEGSTTRRDELLKATAQWLVDQYDDKATPPGWHDSSASTYEAFDGLTLQIFSELLRAEAETGFQLPPTIIERIPQHLNECGGRDLTFPTSSAGYSTIARKFALPEDYLARESIAFQWRGWAIECAVRWLKREEKEPRSREERVRVRRALGHMVVDLGDEAVQKASSSWIYIPAEDLYCLASVPAP